MKSKLNFIKEILEQRGITHKLIKSKNEIRLFPNSFDNSTLSKADLWEYVFGIGLGLRHCYIKKLGVLNGLI